jgi:hypothetical protein
LDGHSNYCIECTRANSKKYLKRKKEKETFSKNENLLKMSFFSNFDMENNQKNVDNLMKILMIERMLKSILDEVNCLKNGFIINNEVEENTI